MATTMPASISILLRVIMMHIGHNAAAKGLTGIKLFGDDTRF